MECKGPLSVLSGGIQFDLRQFTSPTAYNMFIYEAIFTNNWNNYYLVIVNTPENLATFRRVKLFQKLDH